MLEHLGLGITLSMNDDFTPQANKAMQTMTKFESKTDTMSKSVEKSMYNLQNIMLAGFSLNTVGSGIQSAGLSILKIFKNMGSEMASVSASYQTNQAQLLTAFKGNAKEAKGAFDWIRQEAGKTPYDVSGLTVAFQRLKTSGLDMRDSFKTASGDVKQLSDAIGDLATRNMTSTGGASGMAYALQEAWSGQTRSIINRFNLAKADIAGMMKYAGKDQNKFAEEFIKLADRMAPDAMKNMQGTWAQVMSNMEDTWNNFMYDIGKAGIFDKMIKTLDFVQQAMYKAFNDKDSIKAISNIMTSLWTPVDMIIRGLTKVVGLMINFSKEHPKLAKMVTTFVALGGVFLVVSGTIMKLTGGVLVLGASLASTYLNFKLIKQLNMAGDFDFMWKSAGRAGRAFGVLGLTMAGISLAMQSNFMGIRDKSVSAFEHFKSAWSTSGHVLDAVNTPMYQLEKGMDGLTKKFAQARLIFTVLKNTIFGKVDKKGNILYAQDDIINLRKFGLLPMAQTFAILRGRVTNFVNGLKDGMGSALVVAKNFLTMVLTPMKEVLEAIGVKFNPVAKVNAKLGVKNELGMNIDMASKQSKMFEDVGQKAGILLGSLLGFKIIKTLSPILTSPFKLLSNSIGGALKSVTKLKDTMKSGFKDMGSSVTSPIASMRDSFKANKKKASNRFNSYLDEYQEQPKYYRTSDKEGYSKVKEMPNRFSKFVAPNTYGEVDANNMYTKKRSPIAQKLLGNKYYTKDTQGNMKTVGKWGGRLNADRDDQQLIRSLQQQQANSGVLGKIKKPTIADFDGDREQYRSTMKHFPKVDPYIGTGATNLKGVSDNDYATKKGSILSKSKTWKGRFKDNGLDGRKLGKDAKAKYDNDFFNSPAFTSTPEMQPLNRMSEVRGKQLFADNKQGKASKLLFGKRIYTQEKGKDGQLNKRVVARTGGLFRKKEDDMTYNPEKSLGEKFKGSKLGAGLIATKNKASSTVSEVSSGVKATLGATADSVKQSKLGLAISNNPVSSQIKRLSVGKEKPKTTFRDKIKGGFNSLFGKEEVDEDGAVTQRKGFFGRTKDKVVGVGKGVGKFGKGVGKVGRGIGRGVGGVARGAGKLLGGALPLAGMALSAGKMGFDMISAKGGGNFTKGLNAMKKDINKLNFNKVWKKFKSQASSSFSAIGEIGKIAFTKLKEVLPTILQDAWDGIKGGASLVWAFIKENGVTMLSGLVDWVIADGIPMVFKALLGIGTWILTDLFPVLWSAISNIVPRIAKGILDFLVQGLQSLGDVLGRILVGGLTSVLKALLPKPVEGTVLKALGLPTHHGGLFMSANEHMAVIRKDETVLPPDISKKFGAVIRDVDTSNKSKNITIPKKTSKAEDILNNPKPKNNPKAEAPVDNSVTIEKLELIVKADKLSRADARKQAQMVIEEMKSINKEKAIRTYK